MSEFKKPTCLECFWFDQKHESLKEVLSFNGYCRKKLPIPKEIEKHCFGTWPIVDEQDFCGEFTIGG